jgi:hypothetical protein
MQTSCSQCSGFSLRLIIFLVPPVGISPCRFKPGSVFFLLIFDILKVMLRDLALIGNAPAGPDSNLVCGGSLLPSDFDGTD